MNVNKININQSEPTYYIASNAYNVTYEDSNVGDKLNELNEKVDALALGTFYGFFPNSTSLPTDVTTPGYSYVGLDNPYNIWNFNGKRWSDSGTSIDMNVDADEEDITRNRDGKLQFKDRASYGNGMGYVILRKDKSFAEQMTKENTIYEIRYDFTLDKNVTIPYNCVLKFEGGSIKNATGNTYKVTGNHTTFNLDVAYNIFDDTLGEGFELPYIDVRWFGAISDYNENTKVGTDNSFAFERAINCIGQYYNGLYIKLIGQYYINTAISTVYDLNIWGSHFNTRRLLGTSYTSNISSPSLIAIGNITAFTLIGRGGDSMKYCNFNIKNIKVVGTQSRAGIFINYTAGGAPSRVSIIEECEFTDLNICFQSITSGNTALGNCTIQKCVAYYNGKFINVVSNTNESTVCNLIIKDSNIEQNGYGCISIERLFGNVIIDNNILEGQNNALYITIRDGNIGITRNYFEDNHGDYLVYIRSTNEKEAYVRFYNNYITNCINKYNFSFIHLDEFDQFGNIGEGTILNQCCLNCDYSLLDLSKLGSCVLYLNPDVINTIKPAKSNIHLNEIVKNKYLVKSNIDWHGGYDDNQSDDRYFNYMFTCIPGSGMFLIGFYADNGNNVLVIYPYNEFPLVIARLKPYQGQSSTLYFGQPNGGTVKASDPIKFNSIDEVFCPSIFSKIIGELPNISVGSLPIGFECFHNGKPKYWNGTTWVDATGTPV